ncbi:hypothetical protein [Endozoicomonas sp. SCSIO W0465]|uniref:hypothetical protein n=1 Tax=Endozoicomonas sp. SCSIO W0465 TaxID=2918516 RepID=UPI002074BD56|nr:hypothetical protein [Endozoicomonas sp. SCSIO W0465]USE38974.1 hypothetical protein MJO57_12895 [Endozoicomonas sp. SCSIO W0465]
MAGLVALAITALDDAIVEWVEVISTVTPDEYPATTLSVSHCVWFLNAVVSGVSGIALVVDPLSSVLVLVLVLVERDRESVILVEGESFTESDMLSV